MTWWILTALDHYPTASTLRVHASTNTADHLFVAWAYHKPARHPIYRTIRGKTILCGYKYIWDTPHIAEQTEPGDTLSHSWHLTGLRLHSTIWYYLFAPAGPYGLEIQGPLVHVTLRWPVPPFCRIHRLATFPVPHGILTIIPFQAAFYDTDNMWSAAPNPSRITINTAGLYVFSAFASWQLRTGGRRMLEVIANGVTRLARHEIGSAALLPSEPTLTVTAQWDFAAGDFIEMQVFQSSGILLWCGGGIPTGPHFMAARIA